MAVADWCDQYTIDPPQMHTRGVMQWWRDTLRDRPACAQTRTMDGVARAGQFANASAEWRITLG